MAGANLILRLEGLPRVEAALAALAKRHADLSPLMDVIGMAMETTTQQRFEDSEAPDGSKWLPSLRARTEGRKTLVGEGASGGLLGSITHRFTSSEVEVGTNKIYARVHQEGATIHGNPLLKFKLPGGLGFRSVEQVIIPARPFLGISADDQDEIAALIEDYSVGGLQ
jgi:phage virion morphogenesis protein